SGVAKARAASPGFLLWAANAAPLRDDHIGCLIGRFAALPKAGVAPSFRPNAPPFRGLRDRDAVVAQLVRAPVCGTGGRWFEPTQLYHWSNRYRAGRRRSERGTFATGSEQLLYPPC